MTFTEQFQFLLPIGAVGYLAALLVIAGLYGYLVLYFNRIGNFDFMLFLLLSTPLVLWLGARAVQVIRSIRRYNARVPSQTQ